MDLVMQLHPGSLRNHNEIIFQKFGLDKGADIPIQTEYTRNLLPLLNKYGNDLVSRLSCSLSMKQPIHANSLPLAGHYPALKLGPPWWFFDSLNGMTRYFDSGHGNGRCSSTGGFHDLVEVTRHAIQAVEEPPGRTELQRRIMPCQRSEFA